MLLSTATKTVNIVVTVRDAVRAPKNTSSRNPAVTSPSQQSAQEEGLLTIPQRNEAKSDKPEKFGSTMTMVARHFLHHFSDPHDFRRYMQEMGLIIMGKKIGCLIITVHCGTLEVLEKLWSDYISGHFNEMAEKFLITQDLLDELGYVRIQLKTYISEEEYQACHTRLTRGM